MMFLKSLKQRDASFLPSYTHFCTNSLYPPPHRPIILDRFEIESHLADRREIEFPRQDRIEGLAAEKSFLNIKPRILGRAGFL